MIRLFVALKIPPQIRQTLLETCRKLSPDQDNFRWENTDKIHLTLKFIGEVDENLLEAIKTELDFVKNYHSFNCSISKFDFFFKNREPKILWVNLKTNDSVFKLVNELNSRLEKFSIPAEKRKFKPHLTMLRLKKYPGGKFIQSFKNYKIENMNFIADEIALIQSELRRTGAVYTEIKNYKLI